MTAFATLSEDERRVYITQTSNELGVLPVLVEKDFWVTWTLARVFALPSIGEHVVFKGGTSLSKVFKAIQRFSEDIDLQIAPLALGVDEADLWAVDASLTQRKKRSKELEKKCIAYVTGNLQPALETAINSILGPAKDTGTWLRFEIDGTSNSPVLWFDYPSALPAEFVYAPKTVKLEPGSLADQKPTGTHRITPLIAEVAGDHAFGDFHADVVAMELGRTFWEKATILHAENNRPEEKSLPDRLARHYYDFVRLWRHPERSRLAGDLGLLDKVIRHKATFFANPWADYENAKPPMLMLVPSDYRVRALSADYREMQPMFFGDPPSFEEVIVILREAEREINDE